MNDKNIHQATKYSLKCKTSELHDALKFLGSMVPKTKKGKLYNCEITIKTNEVIFVTIGATRVLYCESEGPVKVTIPVLYFLDIIKNIKTFTTQISVDEGFLSIGNLKVSAGTCFFKDDAILRSINLPINYSITDLLHLTDHYTQEEIEFNNLNLLLRSFYADVEKDIKLSVDALSKYGITDEEIRTLVQVKISDKHFKLNQL